VLDKFKKDKKYKVSGKGVENETWTYQGARGLNSWHFLRPGKGIVNVYKHNGRYCFGKAAVPLKFTAKKSTVARLAKKFIW